MTTQDAQGGKRAREWHWALLAKLWLGLSAMLALGAGFSPEEIPH